MDTLKWTDKLEKNQSKQIDKSKIGSGKSLEGFVQICIDQLDAADEVTPSKRVRQFNTENLSLTSDSNKKSTGNTKDEDIDSNRLEDIICKIQRAGIPFIDKRDSGGALWVVGGQELAGFVNECKTIGISFLFKPDGGKATKHKDAWWAK